MISQILAVLRGKLQSSSLHNSTKTPLLLDGQTFVPGNLSLPLNLSEFVSRFATILLFASYENYAVKGALRYHEKNIKIN